MRIGIWDSLMEREQWAYNNLIVFCVTCFLIFWSHFKCMTTEPGCIPKKLQTLNYMGLPAHMRTMIVQLAWRIQNLQDSIRNDKTKMEKKKGDKEASKKKKDTGEEGEESDDPPPIVDYIDKKDIRNLAKGAEDTSSDSCNDSDDIQTRRKKLRGLTTSMERNMRRLLRASIKEK